MKIFVQFLFLICVKIGKSFLVSLSVQNSADGSSYVKSFNTTEDAFDFFKENPYEAAYYTLQLNSKLPHLISKPWVFGHKLNVSILSENDFIAEIFFVNSDSLIFTKGIWTFKGICFRFSKQSNSKSVLVITENSFVQIDKGRFLGNSTNQPQTIEALIFSEDNSGLQIKNTVISLYSFAGTFFLGLSRNILFIKNITISACLLTNGILFHQQTSTESKSSVEEIIFEACSFTSFKIFHFSIPSLKVGNLIIKGCDFFKGSFLIAASDENKILEKTIFINQIFILSSHFFQTNLIIITDDSELDILFLDFFVDSNIFSDCGMIFLFTNNIMTKIEIINIYISYSKFLYGIKVNAPYSKLYAQNLTFLRNNPNEEANTGPCLHISTLNSLNFSLIKLLENQGKTNAAGAFLQGIKEGLFIYQSLFYANIANSVSSSGCSLLILSDYLIKAEIKESIFENNRFSSFDHGGSAIVAIVPSIDFTINGCKFLGNQAENYGNVIDFVGDSLYIWNSIFAQSCSLLYSVSLDDLPKMSVGIMTVKTNFFNMVNITLEYNMGYVGNIYLIQQKGLTVIIENINFNSNRAKFGNFLFINKDTKFLNASLSFCYFSNNINEVYGLLIFISIYHAVDQYLLNASNCIFKNESIYDDGYFYVILYHGRGFLLIENCVFSSITIGIQTSLLSLASSILCIQGLNGMTPLSTNISSCVFTDFNTAGPFGAFFLTSRSNFQITKSFFQNLYFIMTSIILDDNCKAIIDECLFINVTGGYSALFIIRNSELHIVNCFLTYIYSYLTFIEGVEDSVVKYERTNLSNCFILNTVSGTLFVIRNSNETNFISYSAFLNVATAFLKLDASNLNLIGIMLNGTVSSLFVVSNSKSFNATNLKISYAYCYSIDLSKAGFIQSSGSNISISNLFIQSFTVEGYCNLAILNEGNFIVLNSFIQKVITNNHDQFMMIASNIILFSLVNVIINNIGSGFLYAIHTKVNVIGVKLVEGTLYKSSAIVIEDCILELEGSVCSSLYSENSVSGNCLLFMNPQSNSDELRYCHITNNIFFNNTNKKGKGGAIHLSTDSAFVFNNSFKNNTSPYGGAIYLYNIYQVLNNKTVSISDNEFSFNKALEAGGGTYWNIKKPEGLDSNKYILNEAYRYGENFASPLIRMVLEIDGEESTSEKGLKLDLIRPGFITNKTVYLKLADAYYQTLRQDGRLYSEINLLPSPYDIGLFGRLIGELSLENNSTKFNKFAISTNKTGVWLNLSFISNLIIKVEEAVFINITKLHRNENFSNGSYFIFLPVFINRCEIGEILSKEEKVCRSCPLGSFSFDFNDKTCRICLKGAICNGGKNVSLKPGYWRRHPLSDKIYLCNRALGSCNGGYEKICTEDYTGVKCDSCVSDITRDFILQKTLTGKCTLCLELGSLITIIITIMISASLILSLFTYIFLSTKVSLQVKLGLKSFISYIQYSLLMQSYESSIPIYIRDYLFYSGSLSRVSSIWFSIECLLKNIMKNYVPYLETVIVQAACFLVVICSYIFYHIILWFSFCKNGKYSLHAVDFKHFLMTSFFIIGPSLCDYLISYMMCENIEGELFLKKYLEYSCQELNYFLWLGIFYIPSLLLISLGPLYIYYKYLKQRRKINLVFGAKVPVYPKFNASANALLNIYDIGYVKRNNLAEELYIYFQKILLIMVNQSSIDANIKYPLLLFIILTSLLALEPILLKSRTLLYSLLDVSSKFSVISIIYLLLWISNYESPNTELSDQPKVSHQTVFSIMAFLQLINIFFHFSVIFKSYFLKARCVFSPKKLHIKVKNPLERGPQSLTLFKKPQNNSKSA